MLFIGMNKYTLSQTRDRYRNTRDEFILWNTSPFPNGKFIFISHKSYEINWKYKEFLQIIYTYMYIWYRIQICLGKHKMESSVYYILYREEIYFLRSKCISSSSSKALHRVKYIPFSLICMHIVVVKFSIAPSHQL